MSLEQRLVAPRHLAAELLRADRVAVDAASIIAHAQLELGAGALEAGDGEQPFFGLAGPQAGLVLTSFNRAAPSRDLSTDAELGDGFLLRQGHTLVWVGWEFDVPVRSGGIRIEVPVAKASLEPSVPPSFRKAGRKRSRSET